MSGLLKFIGMLVLVGCLVWGGKVAYERIGGQAGLHQIADGVGALNGGLGPALRSADERAGQSIECASGKAACPP
jgi:X-X-X-Leu-X-X-Gly heptad repeat protein